MDAGQFIRLAITASIVSLVFALGLRATFGDAASLFREFLRPPHRLMRALAAMYVVVPLVAIALGMFADLSRPVRAALLATSVAPLPPILPGKQMRFGGPRDYVFGLLVAVSLASVVIVPLGASLLGRAFGRETGFAPGQVATLIAITVFVPLLAGLTVRRFARGAAERIAPWAARLGNVLLVVGVVPALVVVWPALAAVASGVGLFASLVMVGTALLAGHWLGGPAPDERRTLAMATAIRHPGIALGVVSANMQEEPLAQAAVIGYFLVAFLATSLYGVWQARRSTNAERS